MNGTLKAAAQLAAILLAAALLIGGGYLLGRRNAPAPPQPHEVLRVDTLTVRDTIKQIRPVYEVRKVVERVAVPVTDTVRLHDTTFIYLEREQVEWRDSLATVWASGIQPRIDSVRHYSATHYITREVAVPVPVSRRWGIGVQAGYGAGKDGLTPYVGVGISYNLVTFGNRYLL